MLLLLPQMMLNDGIFFDTGLALDYHLVMSTATTTPPHSAHATTLVEATSAHTPLSRHDIRTYVRRDPWPTKLSRRLITITAQHILLILWWGLMPVILPLLAIADAVRRTPLLWARFYLMIGLILFGHTWGLMALLGCWIFSGGGRNFERNNRLSLQVQGYWADWNARAQGWVYGIRYHIDGAELLRGGPTLLLVRHTSINDTILPIALLTYPHKVRLRIVLLTPSVTVGQLLLFSARRAILKKSLTQ
jgi:hypothetical protein